MRDTGSPPIAGRRRIHAISPHSSGMARTCAVHPSGVGTLPLARMPDRRDLSGVGTRSSRAAGAAAQGGDHAASHDTRANARYSRRLTRVGANPPKRAGAARCRGLRGDYDV
ncbi:conserved hypothetical protein [Burkholderia cenocepacia HI2424]|uniref:Uncharacterized protein n=2 Tax=Burkholderia cepacia complex TaxID=87882 RepID=A0A427NLB5_9BURK|nr:conserved hypothetical protein [Burkholderia cenocepacia HI2424]PNO73471.1 hypothetical protein DK10_021065 [Burkholderia cenocepacia]RSC03630.1 hypothetical protein EGT41_30420 [Burkholderia cenocepacia]